MSRSVWLGLFFGVVFLALAFWGVPLRELGAAFADMRVLPLVPVALLFLLQQCIRAWRQQILTRPLAPQASFRSHLSILCIGFFCINTFPARLGEVVRPLLLRRREGVPITSGFGVIIAERAADLVGLVAALLGVMLSGSVSRATVSIAGFEAPLANLVQQLALGVLLPVLLALVAFVFLGERILDAVASAADGTSYARLGALAGRLRSGVVQLRQGLSGLRNPAVALLTLANFATFAPVGYFTAVAFGLDEQIGLIEGVGVLCVAMLGIALPAPPGFAGVYEAAVRAGLALFGVVGAGFDSRALAYALVLHWWVYLVQAASAALFIWLDGVGLGQMLREARERWSRGEAV